MQTVNFYGVDATVNVAHSLFKILIKLLIKVQESKKNSLVFSNSLDILYEIDDFLWTHSEWLPHALLTDSFKEIQPILLTNELINYNNSNYLFIVDNSEFKSLPGIDKVSVIFNLNNIDQLHLFEEKWKTLQMCNIDLKYFKQDKNGKFQNATP